MERTRAIRRAATLIAMGLVLLALLGAALTVQHGHCCENRCQICEAILSVRNSIEAFALALVLFSAAILAPELRTLFSARRLSKWRIATPISLKTRMNN